MSKETAQQIDAAAALWAARSDRGLSPAEEGALQTWLDGDVRRPGAYARVTWTLMRTERAAALGPDYQTDQFREPQPAGVSRRRWLIGGGALAASLTGVGAWSLFGRVQRYETRKGEMKVVSLADGSVLTLNTATRLDVSYSADRRGIRLFAGEALFDVAKDPTRPFIVSAGDTTVRAVGTSFTVARLGEEPIQVLVREGVVEVASTARRKAPPTRVVANNRAIASVSGAKVAVAELAQSDLGREMAWRDGRLVFEGETLATAVARFARYSDTRIIVDDPTLAGQEIAGIFQANDPIGFAKSVSLSLNGQADVRAGEVHIRR
jgi:transmembrane sensor